MTSWYCLGAIHLPKLVVDLLPLMQVKEPDNGSILNGQVLIILRHLHGLRAAAEIDLEHGLKVAEIAHIKSICLAWSVTLG